MRIDVLNKMTRQELKDFENKYYQTNLEVSLAIPDLCDFCESVSQGILEEGIYQINLFNIKINGNGSYTYINNLKA
jgi:hypothetical protein